MTKNILLQLVMGLTLFWLDYMWILEHDVIFLKIVKPFCHVNNSQYSGGILHFVPS